MSTISFSATYYSRVATGNFATPGSWSINSSGTPTNATALTAADIFIIQNGHNITLAANQTVAGITVNSGGTLTATTFTLTITGNWTHNGTFNKGTSSTVLFTTTAALSISGSSTLALHNLSIGAATTLTLNNNVTVAGNVTMTAPSSTTAGITISGTNSLDVTGTMTLPVPANNGRNITVGVGAGRLTVDGLFTMSSSNANRLNYLNISTGTVNLNGGITTGTTGSLIVFSGSGTLNISGTVSTGPPALTPSTGTVNFTGASQNIWVETYYNLGVSGTGTKVLNGNITVENVLNVASSTLDLGARTVTLPGTGTPLVVDGTLTPGTSTVIFSGSGAQTVAGTTYNNLTFSGVGTKTIADGSTASVAGAWAVGSPLTMSGTGSATVTGALSGAGAITMDSGTLTLESTFTHTGTFTAGTGKVVYSGSAGQSVRNVNYYDLEFSGAGTKTIAAFTVQVGRDFIVGSTASMTTTGGANVARNITGSGNISMVSGTINIGGDWTNNGAFTDGTGTVIYDGTTQSIAGLTYYNLQTSNGGVKTLAANTIIDNTLTIGASTTLDLSSFTLNLAASGTPLVNNGTFTSSTSTVNFSNAASTDVPALNYYNLNLSGGPRTLANSGITGIANTFTPGAGAITVTGSTVNFNGSSAQTIPAFTFNDVILSGSGAKTVANASTVSVRTIEIQNGPTLDIAGTGVLNITN